MWITQSAVTAQLALLLTLNKAAYAAFLDDKMAYKFINNYETKLTAQAAAAATSITVANATGLNLAAGEVYRMTIQNADASLYELVDVTAISGNTLTVQRAKEATTAQVWPIDSIVLCSVTAAQMAQIGDIDQALIAILGA